MLALGITDGPPSCAHDHQAVVLSRSYLARRWAALKCRSAWLVVDTQVRRVSEKPTVIAGHLKWSSSSLLSLSRRGPLCRSGMTSSDSISPHVSGWTVVVVVNLVQSSLVRATWMTLPRRVE